MTHLLFLSWLGLGILGFQPPQAAQCGGIRVNPNGPAPAARFKSGYNGPQILYINFDGAQLKGGAFDDPHQNVSWIIGSNSLSEVDFPPFDHEPYVAAPLVTREDVIGAIVGMVRDYYAAVDVVVTTTRPPDDVPYTMIMVGGHPQTIGDPGGGEVGVAPFDCGNGNPSQIGYAFAAEFSDIEYLATTIAHEAGHSFGLAHVDMEHAIMYPMVTSDPYWGEGSVPDGKACDGSSHQNSLDVLHSNLGAQTDGSKPWVQFADPGDGATVPARIPITLRAGDARGIPLDAKIFLDGEEWGSKPWPFFTFTLVNVSSGTHTLRAQVQDRAGNIGITTITVYVDPDCTAKGTCGGGLNAIGEPCTRASQCESGVCAFTGAAGVCSEACQLDTSSCGWGARCSGGPEGTFCAAGNQVTEVLHISDEYLMSCAATGARSSAGAGLMLLGLVMAAAVILRKTGKRK